MNPAVTSAQQSTCKAAPPGLSSSMAISKSAKIMAEIEKVKGKISDQQARLKELEQKHKEAENEEIVDIVRGMSISLEELPLVLQRIKAGDTLGQNVPKSHKGAPAKSDDFVGRGGARERAEFSPQAETELSGLCDDEEKEDAE